MKESTVRSLIVLDDPNGFRCRICGLKYTIREDDTFEYIFTPDYGIIDMLPGNVFQGIPGLDLDLRRERYIRKNAEPVFITERTPGPRREDLQELLERAGMDHLNRLEWLIRTGSRYFGDNLYAIRDDDSAAKHTVWFGTDIDLRKGSVCRQIMKEICMGNDAELPGMRIDDSNRKNVYGLLGFVIGTEKARGKKESNPRGRPRSRICIPELLDAEERLMRGESTSQEIANELGVSRSTLFRRLRELDRR